MPESVMSEVQQLQAAAEKTAPATGPEKKAHLDALSAALAHMEAQQLSGAPNLTPKEILLDLSDLQAKHPDRHFRWVNVKVPGVADRRRLDGYIRLPESDGGRELGGEIAVFVTTKRIHEKRVARNDKATKDRLRAHRAEVEVAAEAVVRELRDKYGLKVSLDRILVDEE